MSRLKFVIVAGLLAICTAGQAFGQSAPANLPFQSVYGRIGARPGDTGPGQAIPWSTLLSKGLLDQIGTAQGTIPCRGASVWGPLVPGAAGLALVSGGTTVCPGYGVLGLAGGGTGQTTAAAARAASGLNIDEYTAHNDSNYTILSTDRTVGTNTALTAARTWTLPAASSVNPGQTIIVADYASGVTGTNTLTIARAGSDTIIAGSSVTSVAISTAGGRYDFRSDGVSKWSASAVAGTSSGLLSILSYGAKCDGTTNDATAMQTWLNDLPTKGKGIIPAGLTCRISTFVFVPSGAYWEMYGATIKASNGVGNDNICVCFTATDQLSAGPTGAGAFGGTFDGNRASRAGTSSASFVDVIAAHDIILKDNSFINATGTSDCLSIGGDVTHGLSGRIRVENFNISACARNGIALFGVSSATIAHGTIVGAITAPGHGIDSEPDFITGASANPNTNVTIEDVVSGSNGGCGISINSAGLGAGAVNSSQSINVAGGTNVVADFCQNNSTPATKVGHRFINAHGTFGGNLPAVDALP